MRLAVKAQPRLHGLGRSPDSEECMPMISRRCCPRRSPVVVNANAGQDLLKGLPAPLAQSVPRRLIAGGQESSFGI